MNHNTRHDDPPTTQVPFYLTDEEPQREPTTLFDQVLIVVQAGITVGVVYGVARYLWPEIDDILARLIWAALTLSV